MTWAKGRSQTSEGNDRPFTEYDWTVLATHHSTRPANKDWRHIFDKLVRNRYIRESRHGGYILTDKGKAKLKQRPSRGEG